MRATALQYDLFGQHMPIVLRAIPRKASIEDICNIIGKKDVVNAAPAQVEAASSMPTKVAAIETWHPTTSSEAIAAFWRTIEEKGVSCISPAAQRSAYDDLALSSDEKDDEELLSSSNDEEEEAGSGVIGVHKKILKLSLEDLKEGRDVGDVCSWIMDGRDQNRLFSFEACCAVCEIDADSLRENLLNSGVIAQRYLH